jgi:hypothetical protein
MSEERIRQLRKERTEFELKIIKVKRQLDLAIDIKNRAYDRLSNLKLHYCEIDLALAKLDGRYQVLQPHKIKEERRTIPERRNKTLKELLAELSEEQRQEFFNTIQED